MALKIESWNRPEWTPLRYEGCVNVAAKGLGHFEGGSLAMLRFAPQGTVHEHPAPFPVDVFCLEGSGMTSVSGEMAPIQAGQRVRWPAGEPHRLWTEDSEMMTLMLEHTALAT